MTSSINKPVVTLIGGGTGTSTVLAGLKKYPLTLNAIISVADSGGSTGRLRDEFGFLPVGDLRQAIAALATDDNEGYIAKLLLYRFSKGNGLEGHNLGNLILTALQDMTGSTAEALSIISAIFRLKGHVSPVTLDDIQLIIEYDNGTKEVGESVLDQRHGGEKIVSITTSSPACISPDAKKAIESADSIIIGPGDIYGSIVPNLIIQGVPETLQKSSAPLIYIMNLMTHFTQTHNMSAKDHLKAIEIHLKRPVDYILMNTSRIPPGVKNHYEAQHEYQVIDDLSEDPRVVRNNFIKILPQNYLRHDSKKVAAAVMGIINTIHER